MDHGPRRTKAFGKGTGRPKEARESPGRPKEAREKPREARKPQGTRNLTPGPDLDPFRGALPWLATVPIKVGSQKT